MLSQKQRIELAFPQTGRVSGSGEAERVVTVCRAGIGLEKEPSVF